VTRTRQNLFRLPSTFDPAHEFRQILHESPAIRVEQIVSQGHRTSEGEWYDQDSDEWVALLMGEALLVYEDGTAEPMLRGDWTFIPAHQRHRVERTSADPPCVWLAVHLIRK